MAAVTVQGAPIERGDTTERGDTVTFDRAETAAPPSRRMFSFTPAVRRQSLYERVTTGRSFVFAVCGTRVGRNAEIVCQREVGPAR
jgi:hypothetical protein